MASDPSNVTDMDSYIKNAMVMRHERAQDYFTNDGRGVSGLLANSILAGSAQGINLSAGIPNPGASPLVAK